MTHAPDKFWDRIAARYARRPVADEAAYEKKLLVTRDYFRPDMDVLEFGCGTGSTAIAHAPYVRQIRALDISAKMLAIAQTKADTAGATNVTFEQSSIEAFAAPEKSFDAVLGLSILHLLDDRHAAITKVFKLLKPDGIFVTSTPCLGDTMAYLRFILPIGRLFGLVPMVRFFTRRELQESLEQQGFRIEHAWQPASTQAVFIVARKIPHA